VIVDTTPASTVKAAPIVYGGDPGFGDAAENFHEASKLYPSFGVRQSRGYLLEARSDLRQSTARAVKRHHSLATTPLPPPALPPTPLASVISERTSSRSFGSAPVTTGELSALLHAGYGVTHQLDPALPEGTPPLLRTVPSGGGLYPLELYVFAYAVDAVEPALYHFDPPRHRLERLLLAPAERLRTQVAEASIYPELSGGGALLVAISAMFWRTRFKYGLRGYRFALLEAGHVAQNVLLAAAALGLASVPIGGFFDPRMDELLLLDGVNESMLYGVAVGRARGEP
jgi:SagB-type dehydrogenase family enzyme